MNTSEQTSTLYTYGWDCRSWGQDGTHEARLKDGVRAPREPDTAVLSGSVSVGLRSGAVSLRIAGHKQGDFCWIEIINIVDSRS